MLGRRQMLGYTSLNRLEMRARLCLQLSETLERLDARMFEGKQMVANAAGQFNRRRVVFPLRKAKFGARVTLRASMRRITASQALPSLNCLILFRLYRLAHSF